eukprot:CAMPEP_0179174564 /NCGR_PEP_ID=MMETSP0796-20121207/86186_1 /TAXON_ID=73915 /ORGANISM="Pyrodinium bahamense, Strain pbaha01" /LENGTH=121 /DNA_ID=CAMNT_0020877861 /DNA_START=353 /DNA_END=718 /DNA_ORIENTATION=-
MPGSQASRLGRTRTCCAAGLDVWAGQPAHPLPLVLKDKEHQHPSPDDQASHDDAPEALLANVPLADLEEPPEETKDHHGGKDGNYRDHHGHCLPHDVLRLGGDLPHGEGYVEGPQEEEEER